MNTKQTAIGIVIITAIFCMYSGIGATTPPPPPRKTKISEGGATTPTKTTFTDSRDGKTYKKVTIGTQTWMAENLNYNAKGSVCSMNNAENCAKYGRLYNWPAAKTACPAGWHIPSDSEWMALIEYVGGLNTKEYAGGRDVAGKRLKSTSGWNDFNVYNENGTDNYGFTALPGGMVGSDGRFYDNSYRHNNPIGTWWSVTDENNSYIVHWLFISNGDYVAPQAHSIPNATDNNSFRDALEKLSFSVRCVQY